MTHPDDTPPDGAPMMIPEWAARLGITPEAVEAARAAPMTREGHGDTTETTPEAAEISLEVGLYYEGYHKIRDQIGDKIIAMMEAVDAHDMRTMHNILHDIEYTIHTAPGILNIHA